MPVAFVITGLVLAGVAVGLRTSVATADAAAVAMLAVSAALLLERSRIRTSALLACVFSAAVGDGASCRDRTMASPLAAWFDAFAPDGRAPEVVLVQGTLGEDASTSDIGVRLVIDVDRLRSAGEWRAIEGRIQAHVAGDLASQHVDDWSAGRPIEAPLLLRRPQRWRNPGAPDAQWQQLRRTADLNGTIKSAALIEVRRGPWWDEWAARMRRKVRADAARYVAPRSTQSAAIVAAILIGDRAGLTDDVQRRLQAAGTYHVIAISGGNVAILTALCVAVLRLVVRSFRAVALITMGTVAAYGWLVGAQPSVSRAVTAACLYLALDLVGLAPRALNVLALVAMLMALVDPLAVLDVGAWL